MAQEQISQTRKHSTFKSLIALTAITVMFGAAASSAQAANSISLGTADSFAVLAGSAVTNTGTSSINGDVGVSPLTSVGGFPPGVITGGTIHAADGVANGAQSDLTIAYNNAAGQGTDVTLSADPVGSTLAPGVYTAPSLLDISGDVTLDGGGDPNAVFVFQAGSSLIAASGTRILLQNGAQACNVFWQVSSSATIGTGSNFTGNILALTSIGMDTGATLEGRVLARNGAVTLDDNVITKSTCAASSPPTSGGTGSSATLPTGSSPPATVTPPVAGFNPKPKQKKKLKKKHRPKAPPPRPKAPRRPPAFTG